MNFEGSKLRAFAKGRGLSLQHVAESVGVSRQTVNDWIGGQVPKGNHLMLLCKLFGVNPNAFFSGDPQVAISVPTHRQRMGSKITESTQQTAVALAREYLSIFKNSKSPEVVPVVRTQDGKGRNDARQVAEKLRLRSGIPDDKPFDYKDTFKLAEALGIHVIFRDFPTSIKSYAFYVTIDGRRVVFVNSSTNVIDLIFPLLHELVHAVRDEIRREGEYDEEEEAFCDSVASFVQFPPPYVEFVYNTIRPLSKPQQVNTLKSFAKTYHHSLYGIVKAIRAMEPSFELQVGGADSNLRKQFPTIDKEISAEADVRNFLQIMRFLSGNFLNVVASQIESISNRKLAEILNVESELDAGEIRAELLRESLSSKN
ncbi:MAG: XRE family transcriptional regulator [Syntrophorhabdales bacterium]|jgi:transcriptional regulator with XRE-family HTH domain